MKFFFNTLLIQTFLLMPFLTKSQWFVDSPDGKIKTTILLNAVGELSYTVDYLENSTIHSIVLDSKLGLNRNDCDFRNGLIFNTLSTTTIHENYTMLTGKKLKLQNEANELTLTFSKCNVLFNVIFRAYNDGIAFRYHFPETSTNTYTVTAETSQIKVSTNGKAWLQRNTTDYPPYEERVEEYNIGDNAPVGVGWTFPALLNPNNFWVMISESDLNKDYFASHLSAFPTNGVYSFAKPYIGDGVNYSDNAIFQTPMKTPWRVIIIGKTAKTIVESDLVHHLGSPSLISDASWIKPGVSTWSWWSGFQSSTDFNKMTPFIDLASNLGLPYFLVDASWNEMTNGTIPNLVTYANNKNVKIWLWYNSGGSHNAGSYAGNIQPRDKMDNASVRRAEFQKIKNWGVVGVKIDFFLSDKQDMIKYYLDILQDAADYGLMVNFHGSTIPRGWQRTYPNLMSMEAVKGAEAILFDNSYRNDSPLNNVNLAFTRNVIGSMDYTPGIVSYKYYDEDLLHNSTVSHELALVSLFESGIVHLCDYYSKYAALPATVKEVLGKMPTAWDETQFIEGSPNNHIVLARRKGNDWYISGINGKNTPKSISLNTNFMANGEYALQSIADGSNPADLAISTINYQTGNSIPINMAAYGGFTVVLKAKCLNELYYTENINSLLMNPIVAKKIIITNSILTPPANAIFSANQSININPPFEVKKNSVFKAEIGGCQ
jgi:alpha-glucosidase